MIFFVYSRLFFPGLNYCLFVSFDGVGGFLLLGRCLKFGGETLANS